MKTVYLTKNLFSAVKNNGKLPKTDVFRANRLTDRRHRGYNPNRNDEVKNMKIKGFIFDLDGTLADTLPELNRAMNVTRSRFGLPPIGRADVLRGINDGPRTFIERTFPAGTDKETIDRATEFYIYDYEQYYMNTKTAFDGMKETVAEMHALGCKTAVLTNKANTAAVLLVEQIFGKGVFDPILGVKDKPLKPDPDAALGIARLFGCTPDEICFVGDSHIDMQTGVNAGMHTIGVSYGYKPVDVLLANGAEHIANTPREILEIAKNIE